MCLYLSTTHPLPCCHCISLYRLPPHQRFALFRRAPQLSLTHSPTFSHTLFLSLSLSVSLSLALYICLSMTLSCTHFRTLSPLSHRLLHSLIQSLCHSLAHIHLHLPTLSLALYTISLLRTRFVTLIMSIYIRLPLRLYALCVLYSVTLSTFCPQNLSTNNNIFNNL